jgi:hypothetical protein
VKLTVPAPLAEVGCTVIHGAKFCTVQAHDGAVVTPTLPVPPSASIDALFALSE